MAWQLRSNGEPVGVTGPELAQQQANIRAWPFRPGPGFDRIRPVIDAMSDLKLPRIPAELTLPDERAEAMAAWQRSTEAQSQRETYARFAALELQLVDEVGSVLDAWLLGVSEIPHSGSDMSPAMVKDFQEEGFGEEPPFYMVVAMIREPEATRLAADGS